MAKVNNLSVFFPFWNEEENIDRVVSAAIPVLARVAKEWEIIIVDDGSSDKTLERAKELEKKEKRIRVVSHSPNRGYGAALKEGLDKAKYDLVVFTDGDGQFNFSEVTKFLEKIKNFDIVIGYRTERRDNLVRHILMNMLKAWDLVFFGFRFKDIDCGFKMFRRSALDKILPLRSEGAMITTEILAKAKNKKLKIGQVGVTHYPRQAGMQTGANLPVVARAVLESFTIWLDIKNGRF